MKKEVFQTVCDFPYIFKSELFDSDTLVQNKTCFKCKIRTCIELFNSNVQFDEHICHQKFNSVLLYLNDSKFIINGLVLNDNKFISKERKNSRLEYCLTRDKLNLFIAKILKINEYMTVKINDNIEQNFSIFHDVKTSVGLVYNCIETFVSKQPGGDFSSKLSASDQSIKDLYDSLELVTSQLTMIDIFVNPQSISYGNKKSIDIFRMFDKISKLFKHKAGKTSKYIELRKEGGYVPNSLCYQSIELIAIILIDNAIKYSLRGTKITITLSSSAGVTKVNITSNGWPVPIAERPQLFKKFFRGTNATRSSSSGLGVGLWIVRKILEAHNSKITYTTNVTDGVNGLNSFEFCIPALDVRYSRR
ncbi:sensor histidine kinase [Hymenobacter sp. BT664]|uniref:histidine kinase n=1 Tax=Hymenobacter montanus TaxID=2771359 RepID=A0A927GKX5_9BACT|nr:ATP-binding protein [Hymenobacter montanus]MBD2769930.1 sensor histidine kinase [Hymenobacter montanus]